MNDNPQQLNLFNHGGEPLPHSTPIENVDESHSAEGSRFRQESAQNTKPRGLTVYRASAGSGKTYTLTKEYLKQALAGNNTGSFRNLLAVTFTNKATDEMKSRIVNMLHGIAIDSDASKSMATDLVVETGVNAGELRIRAEKVRNTLLHDYSRFSISTIDKFFQKVLHAFVREAGLRPGFRLELDQDRLLDEAVDRLMLNLHDKPHLYRRMSDLIDDRMVRGSAWDVRNSLKEKGRVVFEETFRELGHDFHAKISDAAFMDAYKAKLELITGTFEAEMKKIGDMAVSLIEEQDRDKSDFYYGEYGPVNYFYKIRKGDYIPGKRTLGMPKWYSAKAEESDIIMQEMGQISGYLDILLRKAIELYDKDYRDYCTAVCALNGMKLLSFLSEIESNVREVSVDDNLMPISETVHLLGKLIDDSETPFIYERIGNRYNSFMIDEFQDTSAGQWRNFKPLLNNSLAEDGFSMVVGDVKQSIYRWRNGDWRILANVENDFSNFGTTEKQLDTNYRSSSKVIEFNNSLFSELPAWIEREFNRAEDNGEDSGMLHEAYRDPVQKIPAGKPEAGYVSLTGICADDEKTAKEKISERLPKLIAEIQDRGYPARDIAVLVRKGADGQAVSDRLLRHKQTANDTEHNFNIVSRDSLSVEHSESVRLILALLKAIAEPDDQINAAFINHTLFKIQKCKVQSEEQEEIQNSEFKIQNSEGGFNWSNAKVLTDGIKNALATLTSLSLPEVFEELIAMFRLGDNADEIPFLQEFHDELVRFSHNELSDISAFLEYWDEKGGKINLSSDKAPDAINIITVHRAKGLEFPVVIIPYCDWDMKTRPRETVWVKPSAAPFDELPYIPVEYGKNMRNSRFAYEYFYETAQSLVDNLNLMYVAFTRACDELYVMLPLPKEPEKTDYKTDRIRNAAIMLFEFFNEQKKLGRTREGNYQYKTGQRKHAGQRSDIDARTLSMTDYPAAGYRKRLRLRYESVDYFSESSSALKLRNYGNLMHRAFASIKIKSDIPQAVASLVEEGVIAKTDVTELTNRINKALQNPYAVDWFAEGQAVETERFLLLPVGMQDGISRRPDRIIVRPTETIVIDYKFGQTEKDSYVQQVKSYMNLLKTMGYPAIKGYVWYADADKVTEVAN